MSQSTSDLDEPSTHKRIKTTPVFKFAIHNPALDDLNFENLQLDDRSTQNGEGESDHMQDEDDDGVSSEPDNDDAEEEEGEGQQNHEFNGRVPLNWVRPSLHVAQQAQDEEFHLVQPKEGEGEAITTNTTTDDVDEDSISQSTELPTDVLRLDLGGNSGVTLSRRLVVATQQLCDEPEKRFMKQHLDELLVQVEKKWFTHKDTRMQTDRDLFEATAKLFPGVHQDGLISDQAEEKRLIEATIDEGRMDVKLIQQLLEFHGFMSFGGDSGINYNLRIAKLQHAVEKLYAFKMSAFEYVAVKNNHQSVKLMQQTNNGFQDIVNDVTAKPMARLVSYILLKCALNHYQKRHDMIYEERVENGIRRYAYEPIMTIKEFVCDQLRMSVNAEMCQLSMNESIDRLCDKLADVRDDEFPIVKTNQKQWSFENCIWREKDDEFIPYDGKVMPTELSAKYIPHPLPLPPGCSEAFDRGESFKAKCAPHYWKREVKDPITKQVLYTEYRDLGRKVIYDTRTPNAWKIPEPSGDRAWDIPTALHDKPMVEQFWAPEVMYVFYYFIGRFAFPLGKKYGGDNRQVIPFCYGLAGSGKSTLIESIIRMKSEGDVFYMESNGEDTFGLENCIGCNSWVLLEVKSDLKLAASRLQMMIEGAKMTIPRKFKKAIAMDYNLPGWLVGNDMLPWTDSKGALQRRLLPFLFNIKLRIADVQLKTRMYEELPSVIRKGILIYKEFEKWMGNRTMWEEGVLPDYFHSASRSLRGCMDKAVQFVKDQCVLVADPAKRYEYMMPLEKFLKKFKDFGGKGVNEVTPDGVRASLQNYNNIKVFEIGKREGAGQEGIDARMPVSREAFDVNSIEQLPSSYMETLNKYQTQSQPNATGLITEAHKIQKIIYQKIPFESGWFIEGLAFLDEYKHERKSIIVPFPNMKIHSVDVTTCGTYNNNNNHASSSNTSVASNNHNNSQSQNRQLPPDLAYMSAPISVH